MPTENHKIIITFIINKFNLDIYLLERPSFTQNNNSATTAHTKVLMGLGRFRCSHFLLQITNATSD